MANLNIFPVGSTDWVEQQMEYYIPLIEKQIIEQAVARGLNPNDPIVREQIRQEVEKVRQQLLSKASEYQYNSEEAEKNRILQREMAEEQAKAQERAAAFSGLGNLAAYALFNRPISITQEGNIKAGESGFEKLANLFKPKTVEETRKVMVNKDNFSLFEEPKFNVVENKPEFIEEKITRPVYSKWQTLGLPALSGFLGGLVSGKDITSSGVLVPTALSTVGGNIMNTSPTWSSLSALLGSMVAPKEGLFKTSKGKDRSWLSLGLSTAPLWGKLIGLF